MPPLSWDNYRFVLAVYRCQTISGAARSLAVNETTVSRRLAQIEEFFHCKLFSRRSTGLVATEAGQRLIDRIERVKAELDQGVAEVADSQKAVAGPLRIASDSLIMNHVLVPNLERLLSQFPSLDCELVCSRSTEQLRDADIAIHSSSDSHFDANVTARLGEMAYGVFVSRTLLERNEGSHIPWISLLGDSARLSGYSDSTRVSLSAEALGAGTQRVTVDSHETLLSCVHSGLGKCRLPMGLGMRDPLLALLDEPAPTFSQNLVQVSQPELAGTARLNACSDWFRESLSRFNQLSGSVAA